MSEFFKPQKKPKDQSSSTTAEIPVAQDNLVPAKEDNIDNKIHQTNEQGLGENGSAPTPKGTSGTTVASDADPQKSISPENRDKLNNLRNKYLPKSSETSPPEQSEKNLEGNPITPESGTTVASDADPQKSISPENQDKLNNLRNKHLPKSSETSPPEQSEKNLDSSRA